jgi:tripartite-type tricarboxylate transporter receptor subunit TctC
MALAADAADDWPARAIQVVSPFSAGNANDIVGRVVLDQVLRRLGQTFVVENRPGGGGSLGAAAVAKADPDGYTILLYSSSLSSQVYHQVLAQTQVHRHRCMRALYSSAHFSHGERPSANS